MDVWLTSATVRTKYMDGCCGSMPSSFIPCLKPFFTVGTRCDWTCMTRVNIKIEITEHMRLILLTEAQFQLEHTHTPTSWKSLSGAATALHSSRYWAHVHCSVLMSPPSPEEWKRVSEWSCPTNQVRAPQWLHVCWLWGEHSPNLLWCVCSLPSHPFSPPKITDVLKNGEKTMKWFVIIQKDRACMATLRCKKTEMLPYCAFDVWVFLRWTQVLLPLPLPHGFQVIGIEGGDPSACWHLLYCRASPEVQKTDPSHLYLLWLIHINPIIQYVT